MVKLYASIGGLAGIKHDQGRVIILFYLHSRNCWRAGIYITVCIDTQPLTNLLIGTIIIIAINVIIIIIINIIKAVFILHIAMLQEVFYFCGISANLKRIDNLKVNRAGSSVCWTCYINRI